jgi:hypothetical protein
MDREKLKRLIDGLFEADQAGKLHWVRGLLPGTYQTSFPSSSIVLEKLDFDRSVFKPAGIYLRVVDGMGNIVAEILKSDLEEGGRIRMPLV